MSFLVWIFWLSYDRSYKDGHQWLVADLLSLLPYLVPWIWRYNRSHGEDGDPDGGPLPPFDLCSSLRLFFSCKGDCEEKGSEADDRKAQNMKRSIIENPGLWNV